MSDGNGGRVMLGFDVGSVASKVVVTDLSGDLVEHSYTRTHGRPIETTLAVLQELVERHGVGAFDLVAGTGSVGRLICELLDVAFVNEVICQATAVRHLHPEVRTLIEMGGQDSKLILLPEPGSNGRPMVDFTMNTNCAAGTGSFLDQQASRLGLDIEGEFGRLAVQCKSPPRVAGRCSVFAKSDMIHLQQRGASVSDIVAGLCLGLVRNLKGNLGRAMALPHPIAFCGGVASNEGVVQALQRVFELAPGELVVPDYHAVTGAIGAVLVSIKERARTNQDHGRPTGNPTGNRLDLTPLESYLHKDHGIGHRLDPLVAPSDGNPDGQVYGREVLEAEGNGQPIDAYLGLDVGSISTKVAVIDAENRVLAKIYLMTAGRPLDAVRRALKEIGSQVGGLVRIRGAATTGSGRYLTGDFIGADMVINEITAQATAAAVIDPEVDTIFEIGGQDSKYISLDRGVVVDFEMNHACAAGTGSFLEEQAERLGISIKQQFGDLALGSQAPIRLGERCTVFMESDLLSHQQQRAATDDLVSGLCYSIVSNYINRVVGHRQIGKRIFFQGGTAFNQGVVSAFEKVTGRRITVPPHHEVTGAIGAAFLARRYQQQQGRVESDFGGFELADLEYEVRSFECEECSNNCEINEVTIDGRPPLCYGSRCDRYNVKKENNTDEQIPNLFAERHRMLLQHAGMLPKKKATAEKTKRPTVGIPLALSNYQLLPFWGTFLRELGLDVVVSPASNQKTIHRGVEAVLSTPCFPVKVAHGHVLELIDREVDYLWLPSVITMQHDSEEMEYNQLCPYVTSIPYQIEAAIDLSDRNVEILKPPVRFQEGRAGLEKSLRSVQDRLGVSRQQLRQALDAATQAQEAFERACLDRGREAIEQLGEDRRAVVVISRPYNGCDKGISLDMPGKLRKLGVMPIPMDFLELRMDELTGDRIFQNMYWKYGQRILHAAKVVRDDSRLHAVYLSNFSCGPDSFMIDYVKRLMAPKPSLVLEIDEHSADAGVVTRLEAFLESLSAAETISTEMPERKPLYPNRPLSNEKRTLYIPWMGDQSYGMAAAFRAHGWATEVMSQGNQKSIELGRRYCSGKECLPCIITTGEMVAVTQREDFDADKAAFFMPGGSGPCRFGQYSCLQRLLLDDLGLKQVPIVSLTQDKEFYEQCKQLGDPIQRIGWGICTFDILTKAQLAIRPYEVEPGRTDEVYQAWGRRMCDLIATRPKLQPVLDMMAQAADDFATIKIDHSKRKPLIGVLGEAYVRHHDFANNHLVKQLEAMGVEVTLSSFTEWFYYTNWTRKGEAWRRGRWGQWMTNVVHNMLQRRMHRKFNGPFESLLEPMIGSLDEPPTEDILKLADPYIHSSFEGEAALSVGKMIELHKHGCHGVINVMPFSCMPSTIVGGMIKKLTSILGQMPTLSISYDGQQDPMLQTRLEAFVYQARAFQTRKGQPSGIPGPHVTSISQGKKTRHTASTARRESSLPVCSHLDPKEYLP